LDITILFDVQIKVGHLVRRRKLLLQLKQEQVMFFGLYESKIVDATAWSKHSPAQEQWIKAVDKKKKKVKTEL
jgi:hypothetical protein